jgi:hypothetical protein
MRAIDFAHARIAWTTHDGSHGLWRVVAAARREDGEEWYLAAGVMAGDVYGQGRLPLQPPYSFQLIASRERHVMLRETLDGASLRDTDAAHSDTFGALAVDVPEIEADAVPPAGAGDRWPLTARLEAVGASGARWLLEFPVNHINLRDQAFQVETGPVVIPRDLIDVAGAAKPAGLQLAFIFFNRLDRIDLLAFGPLSNAAGRRGFGHFARLDQVGIELLAP